MKQVRKFIKKVIYIIGKPYMRVLPGQLAFFTVLSLVPLIALLGTIASYFSISLNSLVNIEKFLPTAVSSLANTTTSAKGLTFNIIVFLTTAFFLASNGAHSIIITSNEIYGIKGKGYMGRRLKAILITFILVCVIIFTLAVPVFGNSIFNILRMEYGDLRIIEFLSNLFNLVNIPLTMVIMFYMVSYF